MCTLYERLRTEGENFGITEVFVLEEIARIRKAYLTVFPEPETDNYRIEDYREDEAVFIKLRLGHLGVAFLEAIAGFVYEYGVPDVLYTDLFNEDGSLIGTVIRTEDYSAIRG